MAISGHKNLKEVQTYIGAADRLGLAREALRKPIDADGIRATNVKQPRQVLQIYRQPLKRKGCLTGMVGPEGLEPPTKAL